MRISTSMLHEVAVGGILKNQAELVQLQSQLSSGRRIQNASDDPIGSARVMQLTEAKATNEQFASNQASALNAIGLSEQTLSHAGDALQNIRDLVVQAGGGGLAPSDRQAIVQQIRQQYESLIGIANTRDGEGKFLFAGAKGDVQPFAATTTGATYNGDQTQRVTQVTGTRTLAVSENGAEIFERIRAGNGKFTTAGGAANTGTGNIDLGRVVDSAAYTGHQYRLQFAVSGGITTYDVLDVTAATTVSTGNAYSSGSAIQVAGMQFAVSGAPAAGDTFDLAPSPNQSVFTTIQQAIAAISAPQETGAQQAQATTRLGAALGNLDQGLERTLSVRAKFGASLAELGALGESNSSTDLALRSQISEIMDVDYAKAVSDFARQKQALDAAQASYAQIMKRSLFDILG